MLHWAESTSVFMEGKAAMIYDANVFKSLYENPKESKVAGKVGYAVIPAGPAGSVPARLQLEPLDQQEQRPQAPEGGVALRPVGHQQTQRLGALLAGVPAGRASAWDSAEYKAGTSSRTGPPARRSPLKSASPSGTRRSSTCPRSATSPAR